MQGEWDRELAPGRPEASSCSLPTPDYISLDMALMINLTLGFTLAKEAG